MAIDPRVDAVGRAQADGGMQQRLADVEKGVGRLQRAMGTVPVGSGTPTAALPDGSLYLDSAAVPPRLYVRAAGTWRYTTLT